MMLLKLYLKCKLLLILNNKLVIKAHYNCINVYLWLLRCQNSFIILDETSKSTSEDTVAPQSNGII